jgi:hypothetical protein
MVLKQRAYHRVADHDIGYFERLQLQSSEPVYTLSKFCLLKIRDASHTEILGDKVRFA